MLWFTGRGLLSLKVILERKNGILEKLMLSSIETIDLNCLAFEKSAFLCTSIWRHTNRQTDGQHHCVKLLHLRMEG